MELFAIILISAVVVVVLAYLAALCLAALLYIVGFKDGAQRLVSLVNRVTPGI